MRKTSILLFFLIISSSILSVKAEQVTPNPEILIEGLNGAYFRIYMNISGFEYDRHEDFEIWRHDFFDIKIFEMESTDQYDLGLEYEFILKRKTAINKIEIPIESEGLSFHYQPEMSGGPLNMTQPENVIGSYAVYHTNKRDNEYKTGKLFHIYKPLLIDADNETEWADIFIDESKKVLRVDLPTQFLKKAKYPVVVDPTFGYTIIGGSQAQISQNIMVGANYTVQSGSGNLRRIYAYIRDRDGGSTITRAFIYAQGSEIYLHNSIDTGVGVTWDWYIFRGLNFNVSDSSVYWLGLMTKDPTGLRLAYDLVLAYGGGIFTDALPGYGLPYQFNFDSYTSDLAMSIYAEYDLFEEPEEPVPEEIDETPYLAIGIILSIIILLLMNRTRK